MEMIETLVKIRPGDFLMGSPPDEAGHNPDETQHRVHLTRPFWLGRYPVTQTEWEAVMGNNPSEFKGPRRPVERVNWEEANEFCRRLTDYYRAGETVFNAIKFRLPTEAEWEYACRAGTTSAFNDGSACTQPDGKDSALDRLGWFWMNSELETHPAGKKLPNAWGLYDMHGNVWEWCLDFVNWEDAMMTNIYVDGIVDPFCREGTGCVVRGGSCWSDARLCRSAYRNVFDRGFRGGGLGFRLAASW